MFCLSLMDRYMLIVHTLKYLIREQPLLFYFFEFCPPFQHLFIYKRKGCPLFTFFHVINKKNPARLIYVHPTCLLDTCMLY